VSQRILAWSVLAVGLGLAVLGAALVLNLVSLRDLVELTHVDPAIAVVFEARDEVSHRRAQGLELVLGGVGLSMAALTTWWLRRTPAS
jgi:hypothetical protein